MSTTAARVQNGNASHFYTKDGKPMHFVERSDGQGTRPATLRDAKKLGLLPSPTSILKVLRAPQLEAWLQEQCCLAVLTTPRKPGEELDAFVKRVLHEERQQDEQAQKARDLGTAIHDGIEQVLNGRECAEELDPFVLPAVKAMSQFGKVVATEQVVIGNGYAGRADCIFSDAVLDVKSTGSVKLPTDAYWEHRCQASAYAKAIGNITQIAVLYVSTRTPGQLSLCVQTDWSREWRAFELLLHYWQLANDYPLTTQAASVS